MKRFTRGFGLVLAIGSLLAPTAFFFFWTASTSLKFEVDNAAMPPIFFPDKIAWRNYVDILRDAHFARAFKNSLAITGCAVFAGLALGAPAAWALARLRAHRLSALILVARMTPGLCFLIPFFLIFQQWDADNGLAPQIILHLALTLPMVIWTMADFFAALPKHWEEAALIDGASSLQLFRYIALPLARPALAIAGVLAAMVSWNNFMFGLVLSSRETRTLPVALDAMLSNEQTSWGPLAAAAILTIAPIAALAFYAQRSVVAPTEK